MAPHFHARADFLRASAENRAIKDIRMVLYTSIAIFLHYAIALIISSGYSIGAAMLMIGSITLGDRRTLPNMGRDDWLIVTALALYFAVNVAANLIHSAPAAEYDAPFRFLVAIPVIWLLRRSPPRPAFLWSGLALGGIGSGIFVGWQTLILGIDRAGGHTNPIQYAYISILLGILCLAGLVWSSLQKRRRLWMPAMFAGSLMGILGAFLTGSRGSWLSIPLVLVALYFFYGREFKGIYLVLVATLALGTGAIVYTSAHTDVEARVQQAVAEASGYFEAKHVDSAKASTPVGARLEMWRMGIMLFPVHPWSGWGKEGYMHRAAELAKAGVVNPVVTQHSHLHDDYLDAAVKRGIPGLLAVLALYFIPFCLFIRHFRQARAPARPYAFAGALLGICYFSFGLTDSFLTHDDGVTIYAFTLVILWSLLRNEEQLDPLLKTRTNLTSAE